ncbi:CLUMA_CG013480, isoform A [Clunio marinus]|uniref:CLUMA_CG013480, isoform A n=1 Tax=Clunio marinus TaxID=568069 RepID=A0A1J1IMA0_9DIPT|nr:CLUMA_CG013480, isoform A [Clunio marinus]
MLGTQSSNNNLKLKNNRLIGVNCKPSTNSSEHSDYIDEDYSDYVVKNDIPEMKLLPIDYVHKAVKPSCAPPPPPVKCKCLKPENPKSALKVTISEPMNMEKNPNEKSSSKYLVYKKKHSIFGTTQATPEKLQYVNGNDKKPAKVSTPDPPKVKEGKKRYLIFDSKKSNNKLDSIQYYFDNKSYEKYVDNKLYGKLNRNLTPEPKEIDVDMMNGFENSLSWEYRDNSKTENKLKMFESKLEPRQTWTTRSDGSTSGASTCSEVSLKQRNCRLKPGLKFTVSKSIGDLSMRTSQDVDRINLLFANAKPHQVGSKMNFDRDKYKIHRQMNKEKTESSACGSHSERNLTKDNLKKYHRTTTELNIEKLPVSSKSSCGFQNCKFSDCPVSSNSEKSTASTPVNARRTRFDENFIKKFEDMRKNSNAMMKNNDGAVIKSNISVNGKSNIFVNDTKCNFTQNDQDAFIIDRFKEKETLVSKTSNQNKTTIKINDNCFVVNHNNEVKINNNEKNKNIIELNSNSNDKVSNWDKNIKVKNNPQPKFNNKIGINNKIKNEENSVKIYVLGNDNSSPTPSATMSISSSDSEKDYGYFDTSSQGRSSSPEFAEMFKKFRQMCNVKLNPLGCDGALFWNNSYFDEDEIENENDLVTQNNNNKTTENDADSPLYACTKCHTTKEDLLSNYICICRNKVENYITRPLSCEGPSDSGVSVSSEYISPDGDNSSLATQTQTDIESHRLKRGHVLAELLETERIYVNEMNSILTIESKYVCLEVRYRFNVIDTFSKSETFQNITIMMMMMIMMITMLAETF